MLNTLRGFFPFQFQGFLFFQKLLELRAIQLSVQQRLLIAQFLLSGFQLFDGVFKRANSGLRQFGLPAGIR